MNNNEAKDLIVKTFENSFDKKNYIEFIINLLNLKKKDLINNRPYTGIYLTKAYKDYIKSFYRIAKFEDVDAKKIDVLVVNLRKESSLKKARSMQRNFVAWYLKGSRGGQFKNAALVAYVSPDSDDWRFSLVKIDYKFENGELVEEKSPAKRYSYLVGANENSHTAKSRFVDLLMHEKTDPKLLDLEKAFSVEEVTDEFYLQYRELFINLTKSFNEIKENDENVSKEFNKKNIKSVNFTKKLLGQIVFLYFLQKKGWFGVGINSEWGTGPKNFLRRIFNKDYADYDNFFNDILEPLFYNTLSIDRHSNDDYSDKFYCKIPFLNGGLFDPINDYDWLHTDILLPNELFSNEIKTKEDIGTGILDVFDRFNFTVKEDEPLEKEVAVDPEMLGKIFEKLCGVKDENFNEWIKAITSNRKSVEKKFNKKYGIYYTPRPIVHYMCQESLLQYLCSSVDNSIKKDSIEYFITHGENQLQYEEVIEKKHPKSYKENVLLRPIKEYAILLDKKLKNIKVCDPAVGSGAFAVEMINLISKARNFLSNYLSNENRNIYNFKREAIEKSIFGVDIDPGAIEIAKLRLWLSLIVDEEDYKKIKPLPNLSYKLMQGNSLLEEFEGIRLFDEKLLDEKNESRYKGLEKLKKQERTIEKQIIKYYKKNIDFKKRKSMKRPYKLVRLEDKLKKIKKSLKHLKNKKPSNFDNTLNFLGKESSAKIWQDLREYHKKFMIAYTHEEKSSYLQKIQDLEWKLIERTLEESKREDLIPKVMRFKKNNYRPFFLWRLHFAEVFKEKGGFDIVIGNPPYGIKVSKSLTEKYKLENKDSYGLFFSLALNKLIKKDKFLSYIISDTWLTIRTHLELRKQVLKKKIINILRLNKDCFQATVNACIINLQNSNYRDNQLVVGDLCNISTRSELNKLNEIIYNLKDYINISTPKFAVYEYKQDLIKKNSNLPFFVASPKLFELMNNTTFIAEEKKLAKIRKINFNGNNLRIIRMGDISEVKVGLQTGDNKYYLFQNPESRGNYKNILNYKQYLLSKKELKKIFKDDKLRHKVIKRGFHKNKTENNFDFDLWFNGKYIVPYDKGGESDTEEGWLPNYYVPTDYYIDWSTASVRRLKTLTTRQRNKYYGKKGGKNKLCSRFQNKSTYFKKGITFSMRGIYAPTFRISSLGLFDVMSSMIFPSNDIIGTKKFLAVLNSKIMKYLLKNYVEHTVAIDVDAIKETPIIIGLMKKAEKLVEEVIEKQKRNLRYDYMSNEQKKIDKIMYNLYGLNVEDVKEVETWYARRYPKLKKFAKQN